MAPIGSFNGYISAWPGYSPISYVVWGKPYRCIFFKLCKVQKSNHWQFTFNFPLKVNQSSFIVCRICPKTGSTVPSRFE